MFGSFNDNFVSIRFNLFKGTSKGKILKALDKICDETGIKIVRTRYLVMKKNPEANDVVQFSFSSTGQTITNEGLSSGIMRVIDSNSKYKNYRCVTVDVELEKDLLDKNNNPITVIKIEESKKINNNSMKIIYYAGSMFSGLIPTKLKESKEERIFFSLKTNFKKNTEYFDKIRIVNLGITSGIIDSFTTNKNAHTYLVKGLKELIIKHDLKIKGISKIRLTSEKTVIITKHEYKKINLNDINELATLIEKVIEKHKDTVCTGLDIEVLLEEPILDYEGNPLNCIIASLSNYSNDKSDENAIKTKLTYSTMSEETGDVYETQIEPIIKVQLFSKTGLSVELIEAILYNLDDNKLKIDRLKYVNFYEVIPPINGEKIDPVKALVTFDEDLTIEEMARKINIGTLANMYVSKNFVELFIKPKAPFLDKYSNTISRVVIDIDENFKADIDLYFGYSVERPTLLK